MCPSCKARVSLFLERESEPVMMQVWICPACERPQESVFVRKINRVIRMGMSQDSPD
jgi:hypothetical protein